MGAGNRTWILQRRVPSSEIMEVHDLFCQLPCGLARQCVCDYVQYFSLTNDAVTIITIYI